MTEIGLHRPDAAVLLFVGPLAKRLRQRGDFDRVAERRCGPVGLDVRDGVGRRPGELLGHLNDFGLTVHARSRESGLVRAVVVEREAFDHRQDVVAGVPRFVQPPQDDHAGSIAEKGSGGMFVEGPAVPVGRDHAALFVNVGVALRKHRRRSPGQRHVAFVVQQALAGVADRHQRGRARRLNRNRRAAEVQLVRHARRDEIFLVEQRRRERPSSGQQVRTSAHVAAEVGVDTAAREDSDRTGRPFRVVAGILESFPGKLEEDALLRVHDVGFAGQVPEERGVEAFRSGQDSARPYPLSAQAVAVHTRRCDLVLAELGQALSAGAQIVPILGEIVRAWKPPGHADDGNSFELVFCGCGAHDWVVRNLSFTARSGLAPALRLLRYVVRLLLRSGAGRAVAADLRR